MEIREFTTEEKLKAIEKIKSQLTSKEYKRLIKFNS